MLHLRAQLIQSAQLIQFQPSVKTCVEARLKIYVAQVVVRQENSEKRLCNIFFCRTIEQQIFIDSVALYSCCCPILRNFCRFMKKYIGQRRRRLLLDGVGQHPGATNQETPKSQQLPKKSANTRVFRCCFLCCLILTYIKILHQ